MTKIKFPGIKFNRRLIYNLHSFLHVSGLDKILANAVNFNGAIILMYHSISADKNKKWIDPSNCIHADYFEKHMKYISKNRYVISMDELISKIKRNEIIQKGTLVITFDDGYLDNLTVAAPILKRYNLPATIYLATGYIEREENQWIDQLYSYFNECMKNTLLIPAITEKIIKLNDKKSIWTSYSQVANYFIKCSYIDRCALLESIRKQLMPNKMPPKLTMNWDDVRHLLKNNKNITIGSHTNDHLDISSINDSEIISEIKVSTRIIEKETGQKAVHFSCPYSRTAKNLASILNNLGYISSVADSEDLLINSYSDSFYLGRVAAPQSISRLAHYTSGNYPAISKIITGGRY